MTNYERIKAMSVEEMASFLLSIFEDEDGCITIENCTIACQPCNVEEWLESEVDT